MSVSVGSQASDGSFPPPHDFLLRERESSSRDLRVLWIDDDEYVVQYGLKLGARGIDVVVARSGAEGIGRAKAEAFDVIVLDLKLGDLDGMQVLRRLKADRVRTPVLIL